MTLNTLCSSCFFEQMPPDPITILLLPLNLSPLYTSISVKPTIVTGWKKTCKDICLKIQTHSGQPFHKITNQISEQQNLHLWEMRKQEMRLISSPEPMNGKSRLFKSPNFGKKQRLLEKIQGFVAHCRRPRRQLGPELTKSRWLWSWASVSSSFARIH